MKQSDKAKMDLVRQWLQKRKAVAKKAAASAKVRIEEATRKKKARARDLNSASDGRHSVGINVYRTRCTRFLPLVLVRIV